MALIPTIRMKKETAVITVNADQQAEWEAHGYKVLEATPEAKHSDESEAKPKDKKAKPSDE